MPAGIEITQLKPNIWFSPLVRTQILPGADTDYAEDWPTGFEKIPFTANGLQWTIVAPQADIPTDEVGIFRTVASGADTINATLQSRTPSQSLLQRISSFTKQVAAARAEVRTLTVSAGATAVGTVVVRLNGADFTVTLTGTAPLTADQVATQLRAAAYTGWTTSGTGANVVFTGATTGPRKGAYGIFNGTAAGVAGAFARTTVGRRAFDRMTLDPSADNGFILGCDGVVKAGALKSTACYVRMIAYYAQQTENPQLAARTFGADALLQPTLTARCLPGGVDRAVQLAGTGLDPATEVDDRGRWDFYFFDAA